MDMQILPFNLSSCKFFCALFAYPLHQWVFFRNPFDLLLFFSWLVWWLLLKKKSEGTFLNSCLPFSCYKLNMKQWAIVAWAATQFGESTLGIVIKYAMWLLPFYQTSSGLDFLPRHSKIFNLKLIVKDLFNF